MKCLPLRKEKIFDSEEELKILAELGEEEGTLQEEESDMIQSIFDFKGKTVGEIITPRVDIVSLKSDESIDTAMDTIAERQFSKIPIYKNSIDNIKGILYAKDIIPYLMGSRPNINLQTLAREPFFIPETKPIDDLMEEFKSSVLANDTIVLDVRTEEEFYGPLGHIEGATLIPIDELADRMNELSSVKDKTIYVVCRSGNRSGRGKDILNANNFTAVNVNGGMLAWDALTNE